MGLILDGTSGISATGNIISSSGFISATGNILTSGTISSTGAATHSSLTLGTPLAITSGGTGVTTPGTSGNILTSNGTAWVSSTPATAVSSLNGQSGTVVTTDLGGIGAITWAFYAVSAPYPSGTGIYGGYYASNDNYASNTTYSGSNLRYSPAQSLGINGINLGSYYPMLLGANYSNNGGRASLAWSSGGTSLSGSWRALTAFSVYSSYTPGGKDPQVMAATWIPALFVRYA